MSPRTPLILASLAWLATSSVLAFPVIPPKAYLNVTPVIPSPSDRVVISVFDTTENAIQAFGPINNVVVTRTGNSFQISATLGVIIRDDDPRGPGSVDLGVLAPGRYFVEYDASSGTFYPDLDLHKATLAFSVSEAGLLTAVEYYNPQRDHYFLTADPVEMAKLDSGTTQGWSRTGESFLVLPTDTMPSSANPVCRFYGLPEAGLDSHFFSDELSECAAVQQKWPTQWLEESPAVFGTPYAYFGNPFSVATANCQPVYRLYNNRADANHRYTVSTQTRDQMIARGWILEGRYGGFADIVRFAMCVPK